MIDRSIRIILMTIITMLVLLLGLFCITGCIPANETTGLADEASKHYLSAEYLQICCQNKVIHPPQQPLEGSAASLQFLQEVFNDLDQGVNEGRGYKDYLNLDGFPTGALLAWSESYLMQAYAEMFRATGDERYLDKLYDHIDSVMHNRDDFRGQVDYKDDLVPAWGTNRFTKGGDWKHFVAHTGMITYPMLEFVQLVREHGTERLSAEAEAILARVKESVDYHDDQWVIQDLGFGLYTFREDYYGMSNYVCPLSQQAAMGRSLVLLWKLTGEEQYRQKAADIATALRHSFLEDEQGAYVWGIHLGPLSDSNPVADISHSAITIHFITLAYEAGIEFTAADTEKLTDTVKRFFRGGRALSRIDGTGDYAYEITAGQYAFLAKYDHEIWQLCYDLLFGLYRVELTARYFQEDWWGTVMLGITRLARYGGQGGAPAWGAGEDDSTSGNG